MIYKIKIVVIRDYELLFCQAANIGLHKIQAVEH